MHACTLPPHTLTHSQVMSDTVDLVLPVYRTQRDDPQKEISYTLECGYDTQSSEGEKFEDTQFRTSFRRVAYWIPHHNTNITTYA